MAAIIDNFPLYFEATNEKGLSMAGLNFPDNAVYFEYTDEKDCITPLKGVFDFPEFFRTMEKTGYNGKYIIELYEWSYETREEIADAYDNLCKLAESL